ncbi:MAG TPA: WecB/TagA/CpsF family glycosyltransferase [Cyclobacteriaceae bacterium]|nr:WecB/TagA/CpsF family glycosyltransferase [Cyclobacteriaceae bacterium]
MVNVLNIPMFNQDIDHACQLVLTAIESGETRSSRCISATGAHGLVHAKKNPEFATVLKSFHLNLPDGMPGVWIGRLKGESQMRRCYGPEFFAQVMKRSAGRKVRHFFCGGKEGVAIELAEKCKIRFGSDNIVGAFSPPFTEMTDDELAELGGRLESLNVDVVWIGLSTPKQEMFASRLRRFCKVHFIVTVGAAFDFHTDRVRQAPAWIQNLGLEWLFRLFMEPKRLYRRYLEIVPLFIYYNLSEFVRFAVKKERI